MIEEVIRMMLEIINSCLCNSLHHNPNLVYALLYKRELFEQFRMHPSFQDIMQNLDTVSHSEYEEAREACALWYRLKLLQESML